MGDRYRVIFEGRVSEGKDLNSVKKKLSLLFKTNMHNIDKMFLGQTVIKKNATLETCKKAKSAIERTGAVCTITPEEAVPEDGIDEIALKKLKPNSNKQIQDPTSSRDRPLSVLVAFCEAILIAFIFLESREFVATIITLSAFWVYFDATKHKIGKLPDLKKFTNMSAGAWSVVTLIGWMIAFPLYIYVRPHLLERVKQHPVLITNVQRNIILIFLGLLAFIFFLRGSHQIENEPNHALSLMMVFGMVVLAFIVLGIIGLINPKWLGVPTRGQLSLQYFGAAFLCLMLGVMVVPENSDNSEVSAISKTDNIVDETNRPANNSSFENSNANQDHIALSSVLATFNTMTELQQGQWNERNKLKYLVKGECTVSDVSKTNFLSEISEAEYEITCKLSDTEKAILFFHKSRKKTVESMNKGDSIDFIGRLKKIQDWGLWRSSYILIE